ncbi:unnamed protein product [Trichobilharzia regenti]|nr:unnamed protein product [Trichobilharzia regenti]
MSAMSTSPSLSTVAPAMDQADPICPALPSSPSSPASDASSRLPVPQHVSDSPNSGRPPSTTSSSNSASSSSILVPQYSCPYCQRYFPTSRGLTQHLRHCHPVEYNEILLGRITRASRPSRKWTADEELSLLTLADANVDRFAFRSQLYDYLHAQLPHRSAEAIKSRLKILRWQIDSSSSSASLNSGPSSSDSPSSLSSSSTSSSTPPRHPARRWSPDEDQLLLNSVHQLDLPSLLNVRLYSILAALFTDRTPDGIHRRLVALGWSRSFSPASPVVLLNPFPANQPISLLHSSVSSPHRSIPMTLIDSTLPPATIDTHTARLTSTTPPHLPCDFDHPNDDSIDTSPVYDSPPGDDSISSFDSWKLLHYARFSRIFLVPESTSSIPPSIYMSADCRIVPEPSLHFVDSNAPCMYSSPIPSQVDSSVSRSSHSFIDHPGSSLMHSPSDNDLRFFCSTFDSTCLKPFYPC